MPAHSEASVSSMSATSSGRPACEPPTTTLTAASPFQMPTWAPQSIESTSPSTSTREPGMPCTISSFTEVHRVCR